LVAKLNSTGTALVYATYLGDGQTRVNDIAIDGAGNAYVTGEGAQIATTSNAFSQTGSGAFFTKLDAGGSALLYSTYIPDATHSSGIAVDNAGNAYVTGGAVAGLPVTPNAFQTTASNSSSVAFLAKFDPSQFGAGSLIYSSYLGGSSEDGG